MSDPTDDRITEVFKCGHELATDLKKNWSPADASMLLAVALAEICSCAVNLAATQVTGRDLLESTIDLARKIYNTDDKKKGETA